MNKEGTFSGLSAGALSRLYSYDCDDKFNKILKSGGVTKSFKNLIFVEHLLSVAYCIDKEDLSISTVMAIFSGFGHNFVNRKKPDDFNEVLEEEKMIIKTYWFFKSFLGEISYKDYINTYLNMSDEHVSKEIGVSKIFKWEEYEGKDKKKKKRIILIENDECMKRYNKYLKISKEPLVDEFSIAESLDFQSVRKNEDNNSKESLLDCFITEKIEESIAKNRKNIFKSNEINSIISNADIFEVADEMDRLIANKSKKDKFYRKTLENILVYNVKGNSLNKAYDGKMKLQGTYTHLTGKTGAGKSVEINVLLKLLSKHNKRVLIITGNHASSYRYKETCNMLEIKNTMLMGKTRHFYKADFIESSYRQSNSKKIGNRDSLKYMMDASEIFEDMESSCINLNIKSKFEKKKHRPYETRDFYYKSCGSCDLVSKCDYWKPYIKAFSDYTNVIIAPIQTLCKASLPNSLYSGSSSIFEILLLTVDLVIIDEVDEIQIIADGNFAYKDILYSNQSQYESEKVEGSIEFFRNLFNQISRITIFNKYNDLLDDLNKIDNLINFIGKNYLSHKKIDFIEPLIKVNSAFTEFHLVKKYLSEYIYKEDKKNKLMTDSDISNKASEMLSILKTKESLDFMSLIIENVVERCISVSSKQAFITKEEDVEKRKIFKDACNSYFYRFKQEFMKKNIKVLSNTNVSSKTSRINEDPVKFIIFTFSLMILMQKCNKFEADAIERMGVSRDGKDKKSYLPSLTNDILKGVDKGFIIDVDSVKRDGENDVERHGKLKFFRYDGVGREVLLDTNKFLSTLYGTQVTPLLMSSATSLNTKSSLYSVKYPVNVMLKNKKQEDKEGNMSIFCHVFSYQGSLCETSGSYSRRFKNVKEVSIASTNLVKDLVLGARVRSEGVLYVAPSAEIVYALYEELKRVHGEFNIKVLYTKGHDVNFDPYIHIDVNQVEKCADEKVDILIAASHTVARGFNILKNVEGEKDKSYFTDIILYNRYLPSPEDFLTQISFAHILIKEYFEKNIDNMGKAYSEIIHRADANITKVRYAHGFRQLSDDIKDMITGNIFCLICQIKGRGERGGSSCRLHFIDANTYPKTAMYMRDKGINMTQLTSSSFRELASDECEYNDVNSVFQGLMNILKQDDILIEEIYGGMKKAFMDHQFIYH